MKTSRQGKATWLCVHTWHSSRLCNIDRPDCVSVYYHVWEVKSRNCIKGYTPLCSGLTEPIPAWIKLLPGQKASVSSLCETLATFLGGSLLGLGDGAFPPPLLPGANLRGPGEATSLGASRLFDLETSPSWHAGVRTPDAQQNPVRPRNQLRECHLSDW